MEVSTSIYGNVLRVLLLLLSVASIGRSAVPQHPFLGIPPQDENYYKVSSSDTLKCKDGSNKFTLAQLNDDFCDCPDATDEPGTSACPDGRFYCRNVGHTPIFLFSSRVNDGICDCCDGSDEYDGQVKCPNTCWEAGKVARDKLKKRIATYKEGVAIRKHEVEQAKLAIAKDEAELAKLKNEESVLKGLVQKLKEHKEQIEKAEEKERLQKEKEERERKEAEEKVHREERKIEEESKQEVVQAEEKTNNEEKPMEIAHHDEIGVLDDSPSDQGAEGEDVDPAEAEDSFTSKNGASPVTDVEQHLTEKEEPTTQKGKDDSAIVSQTDNDAETQLSGDRDMKMGNDASGNTEGLSKEELGRLVASRWTGNSEKQTEGFDDSKDNDHHEDQEDMPSDSHDDEYDGYASETDDDSGKYDDIEDNVDNTYEEDVHDDARHSYKPDSEDELDLSDTTSPSSPSWLEKIQKTVRGILQAVNLFQIPVDKSEAARVRKEYEESSSKLSKIQSRISSLTQKLKHDFGKDKEFYSFYDHCFESKHNKYVYKVCPFKQASQVEGHSTTRLGRWDKFEDSYRFMIFSNGDKCWNGPDRSLKVKLRCGLKNEITDVDEPSRCEYVALLSTPALCLEEKLKELEDKLDLMNREEPMSHDEL